MNKHLPDDRQVDKGEQVLAYNGSELALREIFRRSRTSRHVTFVLFSAWSLVLQLNAGLSHAIVECLEPDFPPQFKSATYCLALTNEVAPYALSRFLWDSLQLSDAIKNTANVWGAVRNATLKYFSDMHWMDKETAKGAVNHVSRLISVIGQPEHLKSASALDEYYDHLPDFTQPFIHSWLNASQRRMNKYKRLLKEDPNVAVHREDISLTAMTDVNAFYAPVYHLMVILTAIMMPPFMSTDAPKAVHYGAIGKVLGHELTHAFDPLFSNLTRTGDLATWYQPQSMAEFLKRLSCLRGQIADFTGSTVTASNTISETFADTAGTEKARRAYETLPEKVGLLGYTPEQAFYVASCFEFCAMEPYMQRPGIYLGFALRCNLPLLNQKEFAAAFKCRDGAILNPRQRCTFHEA